MRRALLVATAALLITAAALGAVQTVIEITDTQYGGRAMGSTKESLAITWHNGGEQQHTVTQFPSQLGLFDSGPLNPGDEFHYDFAYVGGFAYRDTLHPGFHSSVGMLMIIEPRRAPAGTPVTLTVAAEPVPEGYVIDVRRKLDGTHDWTTVVDGTTEQTAVIVLPAPGTYLLEGRLRRPNDRHASGWSHKQMVFAT